jgi:tetratricopeptide (TPR) repeat protein
MTDQKKTSPVGLAVGVLVSACLVSAVYLQVLGHQFLHWDDIGFYVTNPQLYGFTAENLWWIVTSSGDGIWKPLTWLSFMLEFHWLPLDAPGYHLLINPVIHAGNAVLAGAILYRLLSLPAVGDSPESRRRLAGLLLIAIVVVHPIQVEAVAWLAGRKEVLCAFFYLLAVWCWLRRLDDPVRARGWFACALLMHFLALLAKPMAVTVPVILLALDMTARRRETLWQCVGEKWPFWLLSLCIVPIAIWGQLAVDALPDATEVSTTMRLAQGVDSYTAYLAKVFLPLNLVPYYPSMTELDSGRLIASVLALLMLLGLAWHDWRTGKRRWFLAIAWYGVVFFPVCGWLQVGGHRVADRYAYLPVLSVYAVIAWCLAQWIMRKGRMMWLLPCALIVVLMGLSRQQVAAWQSDRSLWEFAAVRETNSGLIMNNLGNTRYEAGEFESAASAYRRATVLQPFMTHYRNLITAYRTQRDWSNVLAVCQEATEYHPEHGYFYEQAGQALMAQHRYADALPWFAQALSLSPDDHEALWGKAYALAKLRRKAEALHAIDQLLQQQPDHRGALQLREALTP